MNITKDEICKYLQLAIKKFQQSMDEQIELTEDLVAIIPADRWTDSSWFNPRGKSLRLEVDSLFDNLQSLRDMSENHDEFFTFVDMDRLASLLYYISNTLNPPAGSKKSVRNEIESKEQ